MPAASADRNLLFGILALQMDFITRDQLVAGMNVWLLDKAKPLGDILRDLGHLNSERLQLLAALVAEHLKRHGGDPQRSLAALSSVPPTLRQRLAALPDEAVQQSIGCVGAAKPAEDDPNQTVAQPLPPQSAVRYRILRPHAKGGLGEVFVAEDTELGRSVALKEIQNRYADDQVSRDRFVREAEITGGLEHPGIVPVYGLGSYADGRPFYAMRFIKGDNLKAAIKQFHEIRDLADEWWVGQPEGIRRRALPLRVASRRRFDSLEFRQLLRRFVDVSNAVAYAHSRGVLHRDLKPGNIMLGKYGETLVVDWGLAKPTGRSDASPTDPDADATLQPRSGGECSATIMGQALGTPAYMSPEQASGKLDELGPATDIYSLGATLYELLTGTVPFPEFDLDAVQKGRFPPPRQVNPRVPQSLAAVCLKAMALKPADRYTSAPALAEEVERWLADKPVTAWAEPWGTRLRRWVRKHHTLVTTCAALLILGTVGLTAGLYLVNAEKNRAEAARSDAINAQRREEGQRKQAETNRLLAEANERRAVSEQKRAETEKRVQVAVRGFLQNNLLRQASVREQAIAVGASGAAVTARHDMTVRELLARAAGEFSPDTISRKFPDQPLVQAEILETIGEAFESIEDYQQSILYVKAACAIREKKLGLENPATIVGLTNLAFAHVAASQSAEAVLAGLRLLQILDRLAGPGQPGSSGAGATDTLAARSKLADDAWDALIQSVEQKLDIRRYMRPFVGPVSADTALAAMRLALALPEIERHADSFAQRFGEDDRKTLYMRLIVGFGYQATGRFEKAAETYSKVLARAERTLPTQDLRVAFLQLLLGSVHSTLGRNPTEVRRLYESAYRTIKDALGPDHPMTIDCMEALGQNYMSFHDYAMALPLLEEAFRREKAMLGPDAYRTLVFMANLAYGCRAAGDLNRAAALSEEALRRLKATLGPVHLDTLICMSNLANSYFDLGRHAEAVKLHEETLALVKATLGPVHSGTLISMGNLANSYAALGRHADALKLREETLRLTKAKVGADDPETLKCMNNLANSYAALGRHADALKLREETLALRTTKLGRDHPDTLVSMGNVAESMVALNRGAEAVTIIDDCLMRAAGHVVHRKLIPMVMDLRLRHFEKIREAAGCRVTAEMWEKLNRTDAGSLYNAACQRAVTAGVLDQTPGADAAGLTDAEADRAMAWLRKAFAAGYADIPHMLADPDLAPLRRRADYAYLLWDLADMPAQPKK
jgi:serine/threonine protein kinase